MLLFNNDMREALKSLSDNTIDTCITDPPYSIGFMNKEWDKSEIAFNPDTWKEILRVVKPGGYLLAFGATRTFHRIAVAIEDAGWEITNTCMYLYGTGMPKGLNISKGIDKHFGKEQKVVGSKLGMPGYSLKENDTKDHERKVYGQFTDAEKECAITEPNTELAQAFEGYNTTLKPAYEPIIMAMKPLDGTYVENAIKWNIAGLNIDDCRISTKDNLNGGAYAKNGTPRDDGWGMQRGGAGEFKQPSGRWPANVILEHTPECTDECSPNCPVFILNQQSGILTSGTGAVKKSSGTGYQGNALGKESRPVGTPNVEYGDSGGASRFFYCSKASKKERNAGLDGIVNDHTTVKPIELMQYLCKLTMPPHKGIVLDPFMGSGSTGVAAVMTGRDFIGIELDKHYFEIAEQRIKHAQGKTNEQI